MQKLMEIRDAIDNHIGGGCSLKKVVLMALLKINAGIFLLIVLIDRFILRDIENMCDWSVPIVYISCIWSNIDQQYKIQNNDTVKWAVLFCIIGQAIRVSLAWFSMFEFTRHFVILLKKVVEDMSPFTAIFLSAIGFISFLLGISCKFE